MIDDAAWAAEIADRIAGKLTEVRPCTLCLKCRRRDCPRCRGTEHLPVPALDYTTTQQFVHAVRQRTVAADKPAAAFILVADHVFAELLEDRVADRMLGVAGVKKVDSETAHLRHAEGKFAEALRFINRTRVTVQRPLVPSVAGWSIDDVFLEAYRLGWKP
jgi:hypothetical protein